MLASTDRTTQIISLRQGQGYALKRLRQHSPEGVQALSLL